MGGSAEQFTDIEQIVGLGLDYSLVNLISYWVCSKGVNVIEQCKTADMRSWDVKNELRLAIHC